MSTRSPDENNIMKTQTIILEMRAAEGGADAKLLVRDLLAIYRKLALREHL